MKNFKDILSGKELTEAGFSPKDFESFMSAIDMNMGPHRIEVMLANENHGFYVDTIEWPEPGISRKDKKLLDGMINSLKALKKFLPQGTWSIIVDGNHWM